MESRCHVLEQLAHGMSAGKLGESLGDMSKGTFQCCAQPIRCPVVLCRVHQVWSTVLSLPRRGQRDAGNPKHPSPRGEARPKFAVATGLGKGALSLTGSNTERQLFLRKD